ncbi:IclR family transcriptional regulator domain-containing protein [Marinobacterium aestuariivivens]|uniref:IclR family transcriptional regulator C-terminal domain-containing protein n=1 Tax=Marinobacterium aestuariivivens TaxID=1698799 RepID=A0ABW1ZXF7_9GAMM
MLLAGMSDDAIRELLPEKQLADLSQGQFEQHAELLKSLQQDRREGLSWSIGCYEAGVGSCAVPVPDRRGHAVAAINVVGPQPAFESAAGRARIGEHLRRAAAEIAAPSGMARD